MSSNLKRGCHAVACGIDYADSQIIKLTQPMTVNAVLFHVRAAAYRADHKRPELVAIRPRGTCKWTLYRGWQPIMRHHELDYLRMRAALEGVE